MTVTTSLTAESREASRMTRFEQLAYAALSVGGAVSIGAGLVHAEKLLAGWPAFAKLVEGFLS
jgi:hypothetical protein